MQIVPAVQQPDGGKKSATVATITTSRDPVRRRALDVLIQRTLAGEFTLPVASDKEGTNAAD